MKEEQNRNEPDLINIDRQPPETESSRLYGPENTDTKDIDIPADALHSPVPEEDAHDTDVPEGNIPADNDPEHTVRKNVRSGNGTRKTGTSKNGAPERRTGDTLHKDSAPENKRRKRSVPESDTHKKNTRKERNSPENNTRKGSGTRKKRPAGSGAHKNTAADRSRKSGTGKGTSSKNRRPAAGKKKTRRLRISYIHMGIVGLILILGIVGVIRLAIWNRGVASDYDPDDITHEFDTEPEDFYVPADSEMLGLQADDGVTTILLLGNGALAKTRGESDSIGARLEEMTGGKVYDASLDRTYLSLKNPIYEDSYPTDLFSLYWLTYFLTSGDLSALEQAARTWDRDSGAADVIEMLKDLDMSTVDVITIMYDYHDYEDNRLLTGPYDDTIAASCCGCLLQSIRLIQQTYPHIRVIVSSPYFAYIKDGDGEARPGSIYNPGEGTLADYMVAYKNIAVMARVSFIDNYFGTITEDNFEPYLEEDKEHLNAKGREAIAERIASFIGVRE